MSELLEPPAPAEDAVLAHADVGHGLPVVLLHAFPLNRSMWEPQIAALFGECRCVAPDLRGFGDSPRGGPYSMERHADDIVALMDLLQIEQAVIGGLSMGGYIAFAIWRKYPSRVRALMLADTRAGADTTEGRAKREELIALARNQGAAAVADRQITGLVGKSTREKQPELVDRIRDIMANERAEGIIGALEAMRDRPDSTSLLEEIRVPTMIVVGEEDAITPPKEAQAMHAEIRGSRIEVIPAAGHLSNLERPAAFNAALSEFIGSLLYN